MKGLQLMLFQMPLVRQHPVQELVHQVQNPLVPKVLHQVLWVGHLLLVELVHHQVLWVVHLLPVVVILHQVQ